MSDRKIPRGSNGEWNEWAKYVLLSIEDIITAHAALEKKVESNKDEYVQSINDLKIEMIKQFGDFKKDISIIKTKIERKSMLIGAVAGTVPAIVALIFYMLRTIN